MKHLSVLIKPSSSLCNMRCKYCFYHNVSDLRDVKSYGFMSDGTMKKIIDQVFLDLDDDDVMTFAFQGGEPTLIGLEFFKNFIAYVKKQPKKVRVFYSLQTNGTTVDESWCEFFVENQFLVGLSIDVTKSNHDENRYDAKGRGTYGQVMKAKKMFDAYGVDYNVLCVLTNPLARRPQMVFDWLLKEKIDFVQFIPCLEELEKAEKSVFPLTQARFAHFYNGLFKLWYKSFASGHYISIKLFDDVISLLATGRVGACGLLGDCNPQYVVEADGSTYPCDFYVLDDYVMGNLTEETMFSMRKSEKLQAFLASNDEPLPTGCQKCPFKQMCFGGCKRMGQTVYWNESEQMCGYQAFLAENIHLIEQIAKQEKLYQQKSK